MSKEEREKRIEGEKKISIEIPDLASQFFRLQERLIQQHEALTKIAKQAEAITTIAMPTLEIARSHQILIQQFSNFAKRLPDLSSIVQQLSLTQRVLRDIQPIIKPEFFEPLKIISEKFIEIEKSDFEYKWLKSVSCPFFLHVYAKYEEGGNDKATEYLMKVLQEESSLDKLKSDLEYLSYYKQRKHIIDQALDAHKEGKYALSIPTLMAQVDGVFIQLVLDLGIWEMKEEPTGVKAVKKGGKKKIEGIDDSLRDYYGRFMGKDSIRAGVLHGYNLDYAFDDKLAAKVIWILFEALNVTEEIKKDQQKYLPKAI